MREGRFPEALSVLQEALARLPRVPAPLHQRRRRRPRARGRADLARQLEAQGEQFLRRDPFFIFNQGVASLSGKGLRRRPGGVPTGSSPASPTAPCSRLDCQGRTLRGPHPGGDPGLRACAVASAVPAHAQGLEGRDTPLCRWFSPPPIPTLRPKKGLRANSPIPDPCRSQTPFGGSDEEFVMRLPPPTPAPYSLTPRHFAAKIHKGLHPADERTIPMPMNHRRVACLWLLLGALGLTAGRTLAQSFPMTMEGYSVVSQLTPAPVRSTAPLAAPYRAVCVGTNLQIVDESDPAHVRIVSQMTLPGPALDLLVRDSRLYIAAGQFGIILLDVSNPFAPRFLSGYPITNASGLAMNEGGKVLYVCNGSSQFEAVNISDPLRPKNASYNYVAKSVISDLAVINQTLVAACGGKGLVVFNLDQPGNPLQVHRFEGLEAAFRLSIDPVSQSLVAVADGDLGLALVSFPSWKTPTLRGSLSFSTQAMDVKFLPGTDQVVVALGSGGYAVVDVTDRSAPVALSQPTTPAPTLRVTTSGTRPYLLCSGSGLFSLNASNPAHPVTTLAVAGQEVFGALALTGDTVYVTRGQAIQVWNYADPTQPALLGSVATPVEALDLLVAGNLLMASCQDRGVLFFDISSPTTPLLLSSFTVDGSAGQLALSGNILAIADGADGVVLVNIAVPESPAPAGKWNYREGLCRRRSLLESHHPVGPPERQRPDLPGCDQPLFHQRTGETGPGRERRPLVRLRRLYRVHERVLGLAGSGPSEPRQTPPGRRRTHRRSPACGLLGHGDAFLRWWHRLPRV